MAMTQSTPQQLAIRRARLLLLAVPVWACSGGGSDTNGPPDRSLAGSGGSVGLAGGLGRSGATQAGLGGALPAAAGSVADAGGPDTAGVGGSPSSQGGAPGAGFAGSTNAGSAGQMMSSSGSSGASQATYMIGADITWVQAAEASGATYSDVRKRDILEILKSHGFNYVRLRIFVDPKASDGYDKRDGFADLAHSIDFGKRIKAAGMGFLLDFHYSDNWADPGKQCVPVAWQSLTTIDQLATAVHDYTKDAITQLIAAGARPDMVQIGNEITPGMLIHRCDADGQPTGTNPVSGSISNWNNLGALLKAGVKGVKDVDTRIKIMLHIDRGGDKGGYTGDALNLSASFISNAQTQGVAFDVFGESCYQAYQGDPASASNTKTGWASTLGGLASKFPGLQFVAAEYGPLQREINDVVFGLEGNRGAGTFNWEPTKAGDWNTGHTLFKESGNAFTATADLALYDEMKTAYANRL